ncbi:hypothetical protein BJ138DRAFT_543257 [Hygrophoropsis aurantiaca]|uniref:Uncharacterized protein n=1 Tax=Hygrophoropsis aurantiaca TaxID=72124 RepID=A0ACB8A1D8_9AGAM|nr:hypothetical protein BJ138DRAFT_543257 [Hygrophoropsis aurantiaca]
MIGEYLNGPKYWDSNKGVVVPGAPALKSRTVSIDEICGTYQHIYDEERGPHPEGEYFMTLSVDPAVQPGSEIQLKDIVAHLKVGSLTVTAKVLLPHVQQGCPNQWDFEEFKCVNEDDPNDPSVEYVDDCMITVLDVNDDDGVPFLSYMVDWGHTCICYIGKMVKKGQEKIEPLTDAESKRLGMHLKDEEAESVLKEMASYAKDAPGPSTDPASWARYERPMSGVPSLSSRNATLEEICGTYRRVWDEYNQPGVYDEDNDTDYMKLSVRANLRLGDPVFPKDIVGRLELGELTLTIKSLASWDGKATHVGNRWLVNDFDYDHPYEGPAEGCMITILDVLDDNDSPLIDFAIDFGETDHWNTEIVSFVGKKMKYADEKGVVLTQAERKRLEQHLHRDDDADGMDEGTDGADAAGAKKSKTSVPDATAAGTKRKAENEPEGSVRSPPCPPANTIPHHNLDRGQSGRPCPICSKLFDQHALDDHLTLHGDRFTVDKHLNRKRIKLSA